MNDLTNMEIRAVETIIDQTDDQLKYTVNQFLNESADFDFVEYFVVAANRICFPVKKNFFVMSVLLEMQYREL